MPVTKINEIDNTTPYLSEEESYVVFVPGNVGEDFEETYKDEIIGKSVLFTSLDDFEEKIGSKPYKYKEDATYENPYGKLVKVAGGENYLEVTDPGYVIAHFLLKKGLPVLYKVPADNISQFADMQSALQEEEFYEELEDKNLYDIRFLTAGGYSWISKAGSQVIEYVKATEYDAEETYYKLEDGQYVEVQITAEDLNEYNVDATITAENFEANKPLYIKIDLGETDGFTEISEFQEGLIYYKRNEDYDKYYIQVVTSVAKVPYIVERLKEIAESRKDCIFLADHNWTLGEEGDVEDILHCGEPVASTYGAMFSPWCYYEDLLLPASVAYLEAFANSVVNNPNWYAAAGRLRGAISGKPLYKYSDKMCKKLALQDGIESGWYNGSSVNAICERRGFGIVIWGNRTLFAINWDLNSDLVARSFLNIRHLCIDLQKRLYLQANAYMFEQNTDRMWFNFKSELVRLLDNMKTGQGIEGYKIVKLPSKKRAQLRALVRIVPIEAVEIFDLTISLENSNVEVE